MARIRPHSTHDHTTRNRSSSRISNVRASPQVGQTRGSTALALMSSAYDRMPEAGLSQIDTDVAEIPQNSARFTSFCEVRAPSSERAGETQPQNAEADSFSCSIASMVSGACRSVTSPSC